MQSHVVAFIARRWGVPREQLRVYLEPVRGGLESVVTRAHVVERAGESRVPPRMMIKVLRPGFEREAHIYDWVWRHLDKPPAVRTLGTHATGGGTYLFLEEVQPESPWPWVETAAAAAVCQALARLHDCTVRQPETLAWDYERALVNSARATLDLAAIARNPAGDRIWRRLGDLRRLVGALPAMRSRLLSGERAMIHGDMHPGNVLLRGGHGHAVALIDWGRARVGAPMEDVASWLHSLGCWEPQARRRHDSLMRAYLEARRVPRPFAPALRRCYWWAAASNGLSGAIRYHIAMLADPATDDRRRFESCRALSAWTRVVRQAALLLRTSSDC